VVDRTNLTL